MLPVHAVPVSTDLCFGLPYVEVTPTPNVICMDVATLVMREQLVDAQALVATGLNQYAEHEMLLTKLQILNSVPRTAV